jgi:5-methylcytosine-specific restriction endonuclease McrA
MPRSAKRDPLGTIERCFLDPRSFISRDGREFLYGEDTSVRRNEIWERSGGFCEEPGCNRCIDEETMEMHHIRHKSKSGDDSKANLRACCRRCHRKHHSDREPRFGENRA